jgi:hypothetical protein
VISCCRGVIVYNKVGVLLLGCIVGELNYLRLLQWEGVGIHGKLAVLLHMLDGHVGGDNVFL